MYDLLGMLSFEIAILIKDDVTFIDFSMKILYPSPVAKPG
jgi:hypothetical protein